VHHTGNKLKVRGPRQALPAHRIPRCIRSNIVADAEGSRSDYSRCGVPPGQERLSRRLFSLLQIPRIVASDAIQHGYRTQAL